MKYLILIFVILTMHSGKIICSPPKRDTIPKPSIPAVKVERPVILSGKMDDPLWLRAFPVELGYEIMPGENSAARYRTVAMILYDNNSLYVGFRCYDSLPGSIRAHLADRDKILNDDYVIISIDTENNYQRGFEFVVNPYGIQGDLLLMGSGGEDDSYDMVWSSSASRDKEGWTAEMEIPFRALSFSSENVQDWTITLCRSIPRNNMYLLGWTPYDRNNPSWLAQGGILKGLEGIKPGKSIELLPYTMVEQAGSRSDVSDPASSIDVSKVNIRIGGGVTYSPGPNSNIDAVINPDFSQIESDAGQISVNTTFALYYPEKRPFFMSGMDLIQTPMYYSRTINNPLYAAKVNGKAGKISYLALAAHDRNTAIIVPGEEQSNTVQTELKSFAGVGRIRYDMENENFIGALFLSRNFTEGNNYLGGVDWNFKFRKNWYWQGEIFLSKTSEINDTSLFNSERQFGSTGHNAAFNGEKYIGTGLHLALYRAGRNYTFSIVQNNFSPTYQTYNGMFPEVGARKSTMTHSYNFHINEKFIQRIRLSGTALLVYNYDNLFKEFVLQPDFTISMIGQTTISAIYLAANRERFRDVLFTNINRSIFMLETAPVKGIRISAEGSAGKYIYRSSVPDIGKGYDITTELGIEPFSWLKASVSWSTARLEDTDDGNEFYSGHILRNTTAFQFTRKLFLRNIVEYNTFSQTLNIYPLFSYKFNAFTMFCAGMTQDMVDYSHSEYTFITTGYQYFVKLQYLFSL